MLPRITITLLFCTALVLPCGSAALPGFLYEFHLDEITVEVSQETAYYGPADFSFTTPDLLLNLTEGVPVNPSGDLNGFEVTQVHVVGTGGNYLTFGPFLPIDFEQPLGSVVDFSIIVDGSPFTPGFYTTNQAGRAILVAENFATYEYTTGSLTISEVDNIVPEPATLALLSLGAACAGASRLRKRLGRF